METIGLKPYLHVRTAKNPVYHPDGNRLSFIADYSGLPQIWEMIPGEGWPYRTSFTTGRINLVTYIKNTSKLLIGMDDNGNENQQLFILNRDGELIPLTNSPEHIHHYGGSSPDGKWIAWSSNRRHPAFFDIYIQNLETFKIHRVFSNDGIYFSVMWSPDGKSLLIRKTNTLLDNDLGLLNFHTGEVNWLTNHVGEASFKDPLFNKHGDHLFVLTNKDREFFGLAMIDLSSKKFTWLEQENWDLESLSINEDKNKLAFAINEDGISKGVLLDLNTSHLYTWKTPIGVITDLKFSPDNKKLAYSFNGPAYPSDIWELDLQTIQPERLTYFSRSPMIEKKLIEPVLMTYPSFDNLQIPAFFYKPQNITKKPPVIIYLHGGPESQTRATYSPILQYFLSKGYAVCAPNVRGSTGYGKSYTHLDDIRKRMDAVKDLVSLVAWLKSEGFIDPGKIAIMGGSYGGFMVLAAITHYPELWAAAVDIVGISNFRSYLNHTTPWRRKLREMEYGTIEKDGDFFDQINPLNHADRISCPLIVLHGANDPRVPIMESEQIVTKLKQRNHPVQYIRFDDEGHSFAKLKNKLAAYTSIADFLNEYIGH